MGEQPGGEKKKRKIARIKSEFIGDRGSRRRRRP